MSVLLVRHGETALNKARVVQPLDTPLNARGRHQAALCATRLAAMNVHGVLASDAPRARLTADIIHAQCPNAAFAVTPLLQERNFGDHRGTPYADLTVDLFGPSYAPPSGESWEEFNGRVDRAWRRNGAAPADSD
jgi:broad specificity phosphatase PhoE